MAKEMEKGIVGSPAETAKILYNQNFSVEKYKSVQQRRVDRLAFWDNIGQLVIKAKEEELIAFGEEVLKEMKKLYGKED